MRMDVETDPRLWGGLVRMIGEHAGVLYNADGATSPALATIRNTTIGVLTRNRRSYLRDLLLSIDADLPPDLPRYVLVNNSHDDTCAMLASEFPHWRMDRVDEADYPPPSQGLSWINHYHPAALPDNAERAPEYSCTHSIAWLRNRMFQACQSRFLVSFDDDMMVKPGWFEYFTAFQNRYYAFAVINNFASFLIDTAVTQQIGWFDERFLRSHGYEDNDYLARINEKRLRWVLGFNHNHDWRSAEEGNPRGSGTGSDLFIHRYAKMAGAFSASAGEHEAAARDRGHFGNWKWYGMKWEEVAVSDASTLDSLRNAGNAVLDRPPFKGYLLRRKERAEPNWYAPGPQDAEPVSVPVRCAQGRKTTQNTPVEQLDVLARPATATMIDRYTLISHWCKDKEVLDAGCGGGYGSAILHALGARRVLGVDADDTTVRAALERYASKHVNFEVVNLLAVPSHLHQQFDVVTCVEVFEHLRRDDGERLLKQLRLILRPGGTLLMTTPRRKTEEWNYDGGTHLQEYSTREFENLIRGCFHEAVVKFAGITEFQVDGCPQWFSRWGPLDDNATVMLAVLEHIPRTVMPDHVPSRVTRPPVTFLPSTTLPRISILIANRNTLPYLRHAIKSCREFLVHPGHEIIVYDDASTDGSAEWLVSNAKRYNLKVLRNPGPDRKGIVYVYDEMVAAAGETIIWLVHSDMMLARAADAELVRHLNVGVAATCTRVEPPLYQSEPHRHQIDFGVMPDEFREEDFLRWAEQHKDVDRVTTGIFAPVMMWRQDYVHLGGHDKLFAPQSREDSDLFSRLAISGVRFVQSWSSLCYHFSGRGSRRMEDPTKDSQEWILSNNKNERNFIRKYGHGVRHDRWLNPQVQPKKPLTLVGLLGNEIGNVRAWLELLEPYFDEVLLIDDSNDGSGGEVLRYCDDEGKLSPLARDKVRIIAHTLNGDFAAARNRAHANATYDWLLHLDLDERPTPDILERLQDLTSEADSKTIDVWGFRRLNTLNSVVVNDIARDRWNPDHLKTILVAQQKDGVVIRNGDVQYRLVRRAVRWRNKIHEVPESVSLAAAAHGVRAERGAVQVFDHGWIRHDKSLRRQAEQDQFYSKIGGSAGPHADWNPEAILAKFHGE